MTRLIITYHALGRDGSPLFTPPEQFARQVAAFQAAGFAFTTVSGLIGLPPGGCAIALTFDDGYASVFTDAFPILRQHGLVGTVYLITRQHTNDWPGQPAAVPRRPLLGWEQIAALGAAGWEIGAHTRHHPPLTALSPRAAEDEISGSQADIEAHTGVRPRSFCYPYGAVNAVVRAQAARVYANAVSTRMAEVRPGSDPYALPRIDSHYLTPAVIGTWTQPQTRLYIGARAALRELKRQFQPDFRPVQAK